MFFLHLYFLKKRLASTGNGIRSRLSMIKLLLSPGINLKFFLKKNFENLLHILIIADIRVNKTLNIEKKILRLNFLS